jgi:hypothetical protein
MNYKDATTILGLPDKWNEDMLKKAYRQKALRFHPDKNQSEDASFQFDLVKRAFEYLTECGAKQSTKCFRNTKNDDNEPIDLSSLFDKLQPFDNDKLQKLFGACKEVVGITKEMMGDILQKQKRNEVKYELEVKLSQMLNDEVYMLKHNEIPLLVPLWFDDVYYDKVGSSNEIVSINVLPQLPEGVSVKENNHMVVKVAFEKASSGLFDVKQFQSPNAEQIDFDMSKMKKGSKITLWNVGLLKVFEATPDKMNTTEREGVTFIVV